MGAEMTEKAKFLIKLWQQEQDILQQFAELLSDVYGRSITNEHMFWKHANNPQGESFISYAHNEAGEMVAARAFWRMYSEQGPIYQPCDTVTRPDFQRRGLFSSLTKLCLENIEANAVVVNFPNNASYPAYLKLGWKKYADNKRVFGFNLKASQTPIEDAKAHFNQHFNQKYAEYLIWRFSAESGTDYQCYAHKNGVVVSNGSMQGLVLSQPGVHAYGKKSGSNQGYVIPTHFNAGMSLLSASVALPCSSRTAYYLQPEADQAQLDRLFASAQVNTLMDTF